MIKLNHLFIASGLAVLALIFVSVIMAKGADDLDADAASTLRSFYAQSATHRDLALKASGVLIFPSITKGGAGAGAGLPGVKQRGQACCGWLARPWPITASRVHRLEPPWASPSAARWCCS